MLRIVRAASMSLTAYALAACTSPVDPDVPIEPDVRVVSANIGNPNATEPRYPLRLSYQAYEDYLAARIRALRPTLVFLQEVLPPQTCAAFEEKDPTRTCFGAAKRPAAAKRILGAEYAVVCDKREHVECIGVLASFGAIVGIDAASGFVVDGAETPKLPLDSCKYFEGGCDDTKCDAEATVSAITIKTQRGSLRVVHMHPNAPGQTKSGFYSGEPCRYAQLEQAFEGAAALVGSSSPTLVAGDFNFDPVRLASDREKALWAKHVGAGKRFVHLAPPRDDIGDTLVTRSLFSVDHVIADGLSGSCVIHGPAGSPDAGAPGYRPPLDDGFDFSQLPAGAQTGARVDHGSLSCELWFAK